MQYCQDYSCQIVSSVGGRGLTVGGLKYGEAIIEEHKQLAPLKAATDMGDCADAFVMMAKNGIQA